jgi:hypothetical protein
VDVLLRGKTRHGVVVGEAPGSAVTHA